jgi:hypothetical protein
MPKKVQYCRVESCIFLTNIIEFQLLNFYLNSSFFCSILSQGIKHPWQFFLLHSLKHFFCFRHVFLGLAVSYKKLFCGRENIWNNWLFRMFRGMKIEANFRNFVLNHSAEENSQFCLLEGTGNSELEFFKKSMGARNRGGIALSYRPARLHRLAEFIPWNQFRGPINI